MNQKYALLHILCIKTLNMCHVLELITACLRADGCIQQNNYSIVILSLDVNLLNILLFSAPNTIVFFLNPYFNLYSKIVTILGILIIY